MADKHKIDSATALPNAMPTARRDELVEALMEFSTASSAANNPQTAEVVKAIREVAKELREMRVLVEHLTNAVMRLSNYRLPFIVYR